MRPPGPVVSAADALAQLPNTRDVGGRRTASGLLLRTGVAIRGAAPADPAFVPLLAMLGVTDVYDLRTAAERDQRPDQLPQGVTEIHADVLADQPDAGPASLGRIARLALDGRPDALQADDLDAAFVAGYRAFVTMPSARAASRQVLTRIADPDGGAVLLHCTAGKDRTGWIAALLLLALGVPWDDVMADYLASGPAVVAMFAPYQQAFAERGGDVDAMMRAINVYPHYLTAAHDELDKQYGSVEAYLRDGLDLPADFSDRLARRFAAS